MTPSEWLEHYHKQYGNFRVQVFRKNPFPWGIYKDDEYEIYERKYGIPNNRQILVDEIVFDIDGGNKKSSVECGMVIAKRLDNYTLNYSLWYSGGDGVHLHIFFPELKDYTHDERILLKKTIARHFGYGYLRTHEKKPKIDIPRTYSGLINLEDAVSRKGNKKSLLLEQKENPDNKIPEVIIEKYKKEKIKEKRFIGKYIDNTKEVPPCIKYFETEDFFGLKDGRKRALFILASYYHHSLKPNELLDKLENWNRYYLNNALSIIQIKSTINSNNGRVSCRYRRELLKELGKLYICKSCPYFKEEQKT